MMNVYDFFVMICKDFLESIHVIIMEQYCSRNNHLMNEWLGGSEVPHLFTDSDLYLSLVSTAQLDKGMFMGVTHGFWNVII